MKPGTTLTTPENEQLPIEGEVMAGDRTGMLIIRAWVEPGSSQPLRAHVRVSNDVSGGFQRTQTFARADAVSTVVEEWLGDIMRDATAS
ncbi:MAG: hypothetical protein ACR2HV_00280 [Acidimicrobiales bacterium]